MKPVIALVGRPNVGKSTLFNRLTKSRDAIVAALRGCDGDKARAAEALGMSRASIYRKIKAYAIEAGVP